MPTACQWWAVVVFAAFQTAAPAAQGGGENHAGEPPPGAQAPCGGADAAPGIAPGPGHGATPARSSGSEADSPADTVSEDTTASASSPKAVISSCSLASHSLPARSGRMSRMWRRSGGNMASAVARRAPPHQRRHEGRVAYGGLPEPSRSQLAPDDEALDGVAEGLRAIDHGNEPKRNVRPRQSVSVGNN